MDTSLNTSLEASMEASMETNMDKNLAASLGTNMAIIKDRLTHHKLEVDAHTYQDTLFHPHQPH
jgi:hypothetical protein